MRHEKYKELLELYVLGELTKDEEIQLENHLYECDECNTKYAIIKKMYSSIISERPETVSDNDLLNSRKKLFNTLDAESAKPKSDLKQNSILEKLFSKKYSLAFGSFALIILGFFAGYILFNNFNPSPKLLSENIIDLDKLESGDVKITEVTFPEVFSENNEFQFHLSGSKPINYSGGLDDLVVQKLLANALEKTENQGFKIRTVNTIAEQARSIVGPDPKIKRALIRSLKNDDNPGVRKGALKALINFQPDEEIKEALLFVLSQDDNASNRIDAINALLELNSVNYSIDSSLHRSLENNISNEENELIKYMIAKLLIGGNSNE